LNDAVHNLAGFCSALDFVVEVREDFLSFHHGVPGSLVAENVMR
jgi:hypothetical protein